MAELILHNLSIGYAQATIQPHLNLHAHEGEMICLLGQNGCGKSTLIRTLAGLLPPLGGQALIHSPQLTAHSSQPTAHSSQPTAHSSQPTAQSCPAPHDLFSLTEGQRAKLFAVVLTERLSVDRATVFDVVAMGRYPYIGWLGQLTSADRSIVTEAIKSVELTHKQDCFFSELSDGEKQRTLIAKALAQHTPFILLDEPTAHLDLPNRIKTLLLLRQLAHATARTIIISTHELDLALQTADTIWLMTPQQGVETGTPTALTTSGAFQRAFSDPHFCFTPDSSGHLRIQISQI